MRATATTLSVMHQQLEFTFEQRAIMKLWAACFTLGMQDAAAEFVSFSAQTDRPMNSYPAIAWLNSEENYTGSFVWLCDLFDIEPAKARSAWRMKVRALAKQAYRNPKETTK